MKNTILPIILLCVATPAFAGVLSADQAQIVVKNIRDQTSVKHELYNRIRTLCLNAFDDGPSGDALVVLTDFAGGIKAISQSNEESYWRIAANYAVFNVDGDVGRLYDLASGDHEDAAIASLGVLSKLEADPAIGDYFIKVFFDDWDRKIDKQNNARRGEWCSVVAEGLVRHASHKLSTDVATFIDKRVLDTTMKVSLFFAAIERARVNEGADTIARTIFSRTMDPFYLAEMANALRRINQEQVVERRISELNAAAAALMSAE